MNLPCFIWDPGACWGHRRGGLLTRHTALSCRWKGGPLVAQPGQLERAWTVEWSCGAVADCCLTEGGAGRGGLAPAPCCACGVSRPDPLPRLVEPVRRVRQDLGKPSGSQIWAEPELQSASTEAPNEMRNCPPGTPTGLEIHAKKSCTFEFFNKLKGNEKSQRCDIFSSQHRGRSCLSS